MPIGKNSFVLLLSLISALGGYLFGFDFAVISGALPFLRNEFGLSAWQEGLLTGSLGLGCMLGCWFAGQFTDRFGRRPGLMIAALIFAISSLGMAVSTSLTFFMSTRFLAGIGVGMASMLSPLYIAEISPAAVRGRNVAINQLTIVIGIFITNLINFRLADMGAESWRWMFGLGAVPSMLFFFGVLWLPESPRWLLSKNKQVKARKILSRMEDEDTLNRRIESMAIAEGHTTTSSISIFSRKLRPVILLGITLAVFQQFCGINVVFNYTSNIFASTGASVDRQLLETVAIGLVNLIFTLFAMWQVDKLGRRPLMLAGAGGLAILYILLASLLQMGVATIWISVAVLLCIGVYASTLAPVTWVLISEIYPNAVRGKATAVAILALWFAYFVLVFTFPILSEMLGTYGPFYLYALICALGFFFIRKKVVETKGQSLESLEQSLSKKP